MRRKLCNLLGRREGKTVHAFQPVPIRRRLGWPWRSNGRLITIGHTYRCSNCGTPGYAA